MRGSFLQKHFLDAFLTQGAYIESLLKLYVDYSFFVEADQKSFEKPVLTAVHKSFEKYSLNELIQFLQNSGLIAKEQRGALDSYRQRRNRILHDLLKEIRKETFEADLKETYLAGEKIIESDSFKKIVDLVDILEEDYRKELIVSDNKNKELVESNQKKS
jgi:hypothetical protein